MPKFQFNKLVRDKVLDRCLDDPMVDVKYRVLEGDELKKELIAKLHEESDEIPLIQQINDQVIEEIADLQEAVDALCKTFGLSKETIIKAQEDKRMKSSGFDKGVYIEYVDLLEGSEWIGTFRSHADKYKEIK